MKCIKVMAVTALVFAVIGIAIFFGRHAWRRHELMKDPVRAAVIQGFEEAEARYKALRAAQRAAYRAARTNYIMISASKYIEPNKNLEFSEMFDDNNCRNSFTPENDAQMRAKMKRYMNCARPVTVAGFLGDKVSSFRLLHFVGTAAEAVALVRELLHSVLRYSDYGWYLYRDNPWSLNGDSRVRAFLKYQNGREGILDFSDHNELLIQDSDGNYWWYGWDQVDWKFPRKILLDPGQAPGAVGWSEPICTATNRKSQWRESPR